MVALRLFFSRQRFGPAVPLQPMEPSLLQYSRRWLVLLLLLLLFLFYLAVSARALLLGDDYAEPTLEGAENEAVYRVLEAANSEINWRGMYPGDLCLGSPHGIVCDFVEADRKWHIVELNFGWVSDYGDFPPCSSNASFSPSMAVFSRLRRVFFYRCFMHATVTVPPYLWTLGGDLRELIFLENPSLRGGLSPELGRLSGLRRMIVSGTGIGGGIPAEIGDLKLLRQLVLSGSALAGRVPPGIGALEQLVVLDLSGNRLRGTLPPELGGLAKLAKLDLSFNRLGGSLPRGLAGLQALELMDLSYNAFSGGIPSFLPRLGALRYLSLSGNPIGGEMPDFWDRMGGLVSLALSGANLRGAIPGSIGGLRSVRYLALDGNRLAGEIPSQLGHLPCVYHLNLSGNSLRGVVPFSAEFVKRMGVNLKLTGNPGLCFDPGSVPRYSPTGATKVCSDSPRNSSLALNSRPAGVADSAGATGNPGADRTSMVFACAFLFFAALMNFGINIQLL